MVATPWGRLFVSIGEYGLRRVVFDGPDAPPLDGPWADAFAGYLARQPFPHELPIDLAGVPPFTRRVLAACREIHFGETCSYRELAAAVGAPGAARAVGQALARNPVPVVIPCHRVLGAGDQLTGFLGGLAWKHALLAHEGVKIYL
jgi:methylated-DNA-[protein]-cysteine S-methyltransferase